MTLKELDELHETLTCPCCSGELEDLWSATQEVSWLECKECDFYYAYEKG